MLDSLVHRKDGKIACLGEMAVIKQLLHAAQHHDRPVGRQHDAFDKVGTGKMKMVLGKYTFVG